MEENETKPKKKRGRFCRNPNCGWKIIEYPLYKGQEEGVPFVEGKDHKEKFSNLFKKETWKKDWNWYNVWIGDWTRMALTLSILFLTFAVYNDMNFAKEIKENPCDFILKNTETCKIANESNQILRIYTNGTFYISNLSLPNGQLSR